jgi:hypothetical protein
MAAPLATAEDALARLDERLRTSPIREGFIARTHFLDACASLFHEGKLVHLEDLVLHDAEKDVRSPTHELTRAHAVLRARRRIASAELGWALSASGLGGLRRRAGEGEDADPAKRLAMKGDAIDADCRAAPKPGLIHSWCKVTARTCRNRLRTRDNSLWLGGTAQHRDRRE